MMTTATANVQNRLSLNFNLRGSAVYAVINFNGVRSYVSTNMRVKHNQWNRRKQQANISLSYSQFDNLNNAIANDRINAIRLAFDDFLRNFAISDNVVGDLIKHIGMSKNKATTENVFRALINANDKAKTSDGTKRNNESFIKLLANWFKAEGLEPTRDNFNRSTLIRFIEGRAKVNSAINRLKSVFVLCSKCFDWFNRAEFDLSRYKVDDTRTREQKQSVNQPLSEEQLEAFRVFDFGNDMDNLLRDVFCLQCLIGSRVGDFYTEILHCRFEKSTENTIVYSVAKTKTKAVALLQADASDMLDKVLNNPLLAELLAQYPTLPSFEKHYNRNIKRVASKVEALQVFVEYHRGGESTEQRRLCDTLSSHNARHTFVTIMYYRGVDVKVVQMATAHTDLKMIETIYKTRNFSKDAEKVQQWYDSQNKESDADKEIRLAREACQFLGVNPIMYEGLSDMDELNRLIYNAEHEIIEANAIEVRQLKTIYRRDLPIERRIEILQEHINSLRAISSLS